MFITIYNEGLQKAILKKLINLGIREDIFSFDGSFMAAELASIKELNIISPFSLDEIEKLPNLRKVGLANINPKCELDELKKLPELTEIVIINSNGIVEFDVSSWSKLERLLLVSNPFLGELTGLETLTNLKDVLICGCPITNVIDADIVLNNNKDISSLILDINMYHHLYGINSKNSLSSQNHSKVKFAEKIGFGQFYAMSYDEAAECYKKALQIISKIAYPELHDTKKIHNIYRHIIEALSYDYDRLNERTKYFENHPYEPLSDTAKMNKFRKINTSLEAFRSGNVICEGYVNMMNFLLNIIGVESRTIYTHRKGDENNQRYTSNYEHAALSIVLDGVIVFADPQREERSKELHNFFLSEEEFSQNYDISPHDLAIIRKQKQDMKQIKLGKVG